MVDMRTGEVHDYSRNAKELLFEGVYAPKGAPDWARDRESLWNHVEQFERRKDAQLARRFIIALPNELTIEQNRYAIQDFVRENFTRRGFIADVAIHAPGKEGDQRNTHAHVLVVLRKLDGQELAAKKERAATVADRKDELEAVRESWAKIGNRHLERHGFEPTLDCRSFEDRGIDRLASVHLGRQATALEREGIATDRGSLNRGIAAENAQRVMEPANTRQQTATENIHAWHTAAQEAAQRPERSAASETRAGQQSASQAPEIVPAAPSEPAAEIMRGAERTVGGIFGGLARMAESVLGGIFGFFAGAEPKQTAQQVHDRQQAAGNVETQHVEAYEAAQQEKDERLNELLDQIRRQDADRDLSFSQRYGTPPTREADPRERDEGYERERER
jgi:ATP-dependent exoDNAse (exonuclease V) alpha subunit